MNTTGNAKRKTIGRGRSVTFEPSSPTEEALYEITMQCDVAAYREDDQSLSDFADSVVEAITERIQELQECIQSVSEMDLEEDAA
jgi:hypothetical protein